MSLYRKDSSIISWSQATLSDSQKIIKFQLDPPGVQLRLQLFAIFCESLKSIPFSTPICYLSASLIRLEKKHQILTLTSTTKDDMKSLNTQQENMVQRMLGTLRTLHGIVGRTP